MKNHLLLSAVFSIFMAGFAQAGQIDMTTYYDTPDGNFKEFTVTGAATAGSLNGSTVTFGLGGGSVTIGTPSGTPRPFTVRGDSAANAATAALLGNNQNGVSIGGLPGAPVYGVLAGQSGGAEGPLFLNTVGGGTVNIGEATTVGNYTLQLSGQNFGTIGVTQGGQTGEIKIEPAADGNYYATYAP